MKKITYIAAAMSLCMTVFAGCSGGGSGTEVTSAAETNSVTETDSETEVTTETTNLTEGSSVTEAVTEATTVTETNSETDTSSAAETTSAAEEASAAVDEAVQSRLDEIAASGAVIDLSKLSFGMTRTDTGEILSLEAEDANPWYDTYYAVSPQLCSELCSFAFQYNDGGQLYTINVTSPILPADRLAACKEDTFDDLNELFGFSEEDWDIENEYRAYAEYSSETCKTNVKVSIYSYDEGEQLTVSFFNMDYNSFNDVENRSVLP